MALIFSGLSNKRWPRTSSAIIASLPQVSSYCWAALRITFAKHRARSQKRDQSCRPAQSPRKLSGGGKSTSRRSADTGMLHAADQLEKAHCFIGPSLRLPVESRLPRRRVGFPQALCKICTPCVNPVYRKCMNDISPKREGRTAFTFSWGKRGRSLVDAAYWVVYRLGVSIMWLIRPFDRKVREGFEKRGKISGLHPWLRFLKTSCPDLVSLSIR